MITSREERKMLRELLIENLHKADFGDKNAERTAELIAQKLLDDRKNRTKRGRIVVTFPTGHQEEFKNAKYAAMHIGVSKATIYKHVDAETMDKQGRRYEEIEEDE